jgi:protein-S-isoprenylcysteine O-methyltransferase Ste14
MKSGMIKIGNFLFRYRDKAFPLIILSLFIIAVPPHDLFNKEYLENIKDILALIIAFTGLSVRAIVIGFAYIKRGGMNKKVYAENLVTDGIFGICRNPLYVGNVLIYTGVFLMHGNPLVTLTGICLFLFIYQCIVYAEETYLAEKFGKGYQEYCADVPRWIPKFSRFKEATEGMSFNIRRVILKDYTTIATTTIMLTLTECYEYLTLPNISVNTTYIEFLGSVILFAVIMVALVKVLKKNRWLSENPS